MSDGRTVIGPICGTSADLGTVLELIAGADRIDPDCPPLGFSTGSSTEGLRVLVHRDESVAPDSDVIAVLERSAGALSDAGHEVSEADALEPSRALEITQRYWNRPLPTGEATEAFLADWQSFRRRGMELMRSTDVIISPGAPYPAPAIGKSTDLDWSYTLAASLWGFPALVVPAGASGAGLPIGVQVVGAPWMDALVIAVGEYLEIPPGQSPTP
jgi:Asp-tRNA(Asn)/Glu-tRNA(Gln) amidotransferase A subunit family amidase